MTQSHDSFEPTGDRAGASLAVLQRVDSVCDEFEELWKSGTRPRIEDFLNDTNVPTATLLSELVPLDVDYRQRRGEAPSLREYSDRFPALEPEIESQWGTCDASPPVPLQPVARLGRFEIEAKLGEGTFGVVWKGRDTLLGRSVALKQFRPGTPLSDRDRFVREARVAAKLEHPHVVRVLELDDNPGTDFLVFEYVDGGSLQSRLRIRDGVPLDLQEAARLAHRLALGLDCIHQQGIIHRDFKPANVLLTKGGEPKISDFGLARDVEMLSTISQDQSILGTIPYMSPEQCRGEPLTAATDIYSLGVVLYEMLAGVRPFGGTGAELVAQIQSKDPPRFTPAGRVPADLEQICLRALEKSAADRYVSAAELAADLERFLNGITLPGRPATSADRVRQRIRRRDFLRYSSIIGGVLGAAGGAAMLSRAFLPEPKDGKRRVVLQTDPVGAELFVVPLNRVTGEPMPDQLLPVEDRSPATLRLSPGDYLVVAVLDGGQRFHEVLRRVPYPEETLPGRENHVRWRFMDDGSIQLPAIHVPLASVTEEMTRFDGSPEFLVGRVGSTIAPRHSRSVGAFFLDRHEATARSYQQIHRGLPADLRWQRPATLDHAITLPWNSAVYMAERSGKRLPTEFEYEFAATDGGRRASSGDAGESPPSGEQKGFEPAGQPAEDHVGNPPVYGLGSNVAEWTSTSGAARFDKADPHVPLHASTEATRVVRGGSLDVVEGSAAVDSDRRDPRGRVLIWPTALLPGLGVRFARSASPRTRPEHFLG